jgi:crotonobetainyl-CoA:carnitine CoA-transferase CaiB-like acyl-CoA transferase
VLAALLARSHTGRGQHIDIALFDSQLAALANVASAYLMTGQEMQRYGNAHASVVPYQLFPTRDGSIVVAVGNDSQFRTLCETVIECPELATDPRFVRNADRVTHRDSLIPFLSDALAQRDSAEWLRRLEEAGIPHGSVRSVGEALRAPEVTARNMVRSVLHPVLGAIELVASPLKLSDTPVVEPRTPPLLGEHTDEVLRERLGLSDRRIDELRAQGILGVKS